jgi:hypothetical protein
VSLQERLDSVWIPTAIPPLPPQPFSILPINARTAITSSVIQMIYQQGGVVLPPCSSTSSSNCGHNECECSICLNDDITPQTGGMLSCGHTFHNRCISDWFVRGRKLTCPNCRRPADLSNIIGK